MKRCLLILTILAVHLPLTARDSGIEMSFNKCGDRDEIRVGWAINPLYYQSEFHQNNYYGGFTLGGVYHDISDGPYSTGVFSIEYCHFFQNWLSVCAELGFTPLWNKKTNAFGVKLPSDKGFIFHVLPKVRFSYLRAEIVSLYSDIGLGLAIGSGRGATNVGAIFHTTPIGITVGKRVYGFAESNISMKNIGFTIGAGYRF